MAGVKPKEPRLRSKMFPPHSQPVFCAISQLALVAAAETPEFIAEEALGCRVLVHGGPGGEVARVVGADIAVAIEAGDGVVEDVAVEVEGLRVFERGVGDGFGGFGPAGGEEAAGGGLVVAGAEVGEVGLGVEEL